MKGVVCLDEDTQGAAESNPEQRRAAQSTGCRIRKWTGSGACIHPISSHPMSTNKANSY